MAKQRRVPGRVVAALAGAAVLMALSAGVADAADFTWSDVGSWTDLRDVMQVDPDGNTIEGDALILDGGGNVVPGAEVGDDLRRGLQDVLAGALQVPAPPWRPHRPLHARDVRSSQSGDDSGRHRHGVASASARYAASDLGATAR